MNVGDYVTVQATTRLINPHGPTAAIRVHQVDGVVVAVQADRITVRFGKMQATFPASAVITKVTPVPHDPAAEARIAAHLADLRIPAKLKEDDDTKTKESE